jgi:hypothetical protein
MSISTIGFPASLARGILHDQDLSELPLNVCCRMKRARSGSKQRRRQFSGVELIVIRTDQQGFVTNIEPVQINDEDVPHITAAVQYEFAVTLESA